MRIRLSQPPAGDRAWAWAELGNIWIKMFIPFGPKRDLDHREYQNIVAASIIRI